MRVSVDQERCCGSGNCVLTVPEVFDQRDSDGIVLLRQPHPDPELRDRVRDAAWTCPSEAIQFEDEDR
ncbi:MAG TPA: ferredoxin [Mycobacteriales bacterium]|nr:ferredoxin [Mycobacteriales bacterium]